jgi:hypothetical protein
MATMLAQGFTRDQLGNLMFSGLGKREVRDMTTNGQRAKVVWMQISAAGRRAILN